MQFIHQGLAWGFLIALVPPLIHLINLLRQRRIQWAAMEFLLRSYQKHRKWIWLKQMLLLAARMAAICLVVVMAAQWVTQNQWSAIFGGKDTHHYVLLDDSFSMSERQGAESAFDQAKQVVSQIASRAIAQQTRQRFTLLRLSRAAGGDASEVGAQTAAEQRADFNAEFVGSQFEVAVEDLRRNLEVTQLSVGPQEALDLVQQLARLRRDENRVIYLLSDFREKDWRSPAAIRSQLQELADDGAEVHLIQCSGEGAANLAITRLAAAEETRAAGVPLFINATIRNYGTQLASRVQLKVRSRFYDPDVASSAAPGRWPAKEDELPTVLVDEIPPGESVTRRVQVLFPKAGRHVVEAELPSDPVAADNRRWVAIDFPQAEPVLLIDGAPEQPHAYFLSSVFQPGTRALTGIQPDLKPASFLRDTTPAVLQDYRAIYLLDVDRLDERAVLNLEAYVRGGGGVAFFLGEHVNLTFYNQRLFREGQGLFPLPLERDDLLAAEEQENRPDIEVSDHPVFRVFQGERNPLIRMVTVERFIRPPRSWAPLPDSTVEVVAKLRNGSPLVVERQFGEGRVVAVLTTAAPAWNNWGNDPSFVIVALKLQSHLAAFQRGDTDYLVGAPLDLELDSEKYRREVTFVTPDAEGKPASITERLATSNDETGKVLDAQLELGTDRDGSGGTARSGVYEAWLNATQGTPEVRRFALNVDSLEGDLAVTDPSALRQRLEPVRVQFHRADQYRFEAVEQAGYNHSMMVMWLLIGLLIGEQMLGFASSYHPPKGAAR